MSVHLKDWIPYKLVEIEDSLYVEWLYLGEVLFLHPFFEESIAKCKSLPINSKPYKVLTNIEMVLEWQGVIDSADMLAFIFHVSRCGSTMLSQLLSLSEPFIVLSEAPILDEVLQSDVLGAPQKRLLFDAVLKFLGQRRKSMQKHLVVKLDSWHFYYFAYLREWYSHVPFLLLLRNPEEILLSHQKHRGIHMVPGMLPRHLFNMQSANSDLYEYSIEVLVSYLDRIEEIGKTDPRSWICDFRDGLWNMVETLQAICHHRFSEEELGLMRARLLNHSKKSTEPYCGDQFGFQLLGSPALDSLIQQYRQITQSGRVSS